MRIWEYVLSLISLITIEGGSSLISVNHNRNVLTGFKKGKNAIICRTALRQNSLCSLWPQKLKFYIKFFFQLWESRSENTCSSSNWNRTDLSQTIPASSSVFWDTHASSVAYCRWSAISDAMQVVVQCYSPISFCRISATSIFVFDLVIIICINCKFGQIRGVLMKNSCQVQYKCNHWFWYLYLPMKLQLHRNLTVHDWTFVFWWKFFEPCIYINNFEKNNYNFNLITF